MLDEQVFNGLKDAFGSALQEIYIESLGRSFFFKEATVGENKTISKFVISNSKSQSAVYAATVAMMRNLCTDKDFDPYAMSEFDRLKVLVHLFSNNFFSKKLNVKCPRKGCEHQFSMVMKYGDLLKMMDSVKTEDIVIENRTQFGNIKVWANFPSVKRYQEFLQYVDGEHPTETVEKPKSQSVDYEQMNASFRELDEEFMKSKDSPILTSEADVIAKIRRRREILKGNIGKTVEDKGAVAGNVDIKKVGRDDSLLDMADMYIKRIYVDGIKGCDDQFDIDFSNLTYEETEKVLGTLPINLFCFEDGGNIVTRITREIFKKMNGCVPNIMCEKCGYQISKKLGLQSFFIFG